LLRPLRGQAGACKDGLHQLHPLGEALPASRLFEEGGAIRGAALLTRSGPGPLLDMIFVAPEYRRKGIARALLHAAMSELHGPGEQVLWSKHLLANEVSAAWHQAMGFEEGQDLNLAKLRASHAHAELDRREKAHDLDLVARAELEAEWKRWRSVARELEEIEAREGYEAVRPLFWFHR